VSTIPHVVLLKCICSLCTKCLFVQATQSNAHQMQIVSRSNNVQYFVESKQKEAPIKLASATR